MGRWSLGLVVGFMFETALGCKRRLQKKWNSCADSDVGPLSVDTELDPDFCAGSVVIYRWRFAFHHFFRDCQKCRHVETSDGQFTERAISIVGIVIMTTCVLTGVKK